MNETFLSGWGSASKVGMALVAAAAITGGGMVAAEKAQAAGFTGYYAPGGWTRTGTTSFSVTNPANTSATLSGDGGVSQITILPEAGTTSFTFNYVISNFDPSQAFYIANGSSTLFSTLNGGPGGGSETGGFTVPITNLSQPFGFSYTSESGSLAVRNFSTSVTPPTTPIPSPAMLPGLIGAGWAFLRKKDGEEASEEG